MLVLSRPGREYFVIGRRSARSTMLYRGFPSKLHHTVPRWVEDRALFHIRIALDRTKEQQPLNTPALAEPLMQSARFYDRRQRWYITVFMLMPNHIHALLSFQRDQSMSRVIGDWKRFQTVQHGIAWQEGYFDHRLRETTNASNNSLLRSITSARIR